MACRMGLLPELTPEREMELRRADASAWKEAKRGGRSLLRGLPVASVVRGTRESLSDLVFEEVLVPLAP